jgi:hypothetical protein
MIVNYTEHGWEIITQRNHGLLAAQLASHWRKADRSARWVETLIAIAEHDDAQVEMERNDLLTEQGGPVNFKMKKFNLEHCRRTLEFSISKGRYIALLCSMHMNFVYGHFGRDNPEIKHFFSEQAKLIEQWMDQLQLKDAEAKKDYSLLEWCDALSLLICQHENQPEAREIEISHGPDNKPYKLIQYKPAELTVVPWPFEHNRFEVYFEWRLLPKLVFDDCDDFKSEFKKATVEQKVWTLKK